VLTRRYSSTKTANCYLEPLRTAVAGLRLLGVSVFCRERGATLQPGDEMPEISKIFLEPFFNIPVCHGWLRLACRSIVHLDPLDIGAGRRFTARCQISARLDQVSPMGWNAANVLIELSSCSGEAGEYLARSGGMVVASSLAKMASELFFHTLLYSLFG